MNAVKTLIFLLVASCFIGCTSGNSSPPPNTSIAVTVADLYRLAGVGVPIVSQRILGKHYSPSLDHWTVIACIDLNVSGKESTDCNDSFTLIKLDSGKWVMRGTVNGQYRWMEVSNDKPINNQKIE